MLWRLALLVGVLLLLAADAGPTSAETTICYVYNQRTGHGEWMKCQVYELLPDGGTNPDGGHRR